MNRETYIDDAGYAHYRRRHPADSNVVPYNPQILLEFDCHVNVELASSVTLIMYLYKYIYKGSDHTQGCLTIDEIKQYLSGKYLSASEGAWRIFSL